MNSFLAILNEVLDLGVFFALIGVGLMPLERMFSARRQQIFRKEWFTDALFFWVGALLWTKITLVVLVFLHGWFDASVPLHWRSWIMEWPVPIQLLFVVLLSDLLIYWGHRASHRFDFLWRFHKVHHTAERLDWLAAFREHPIDNVYTRVIVNLPALFLGISLDAIAAFVVFRGLWGNFIHSNTAFGMGPLKYLLGSPRLHHWHHDLDRNSACNFANLMPLMDLLFGTFHDPGRMPRRYGINDPMPHGYITQILWPLLPNRFTYETLNKRQDIPQS